ncbi:MAG: hypothetical protein V3R78_14320 [Thermodesulfobacteriota bacterium]
MGHKTKLKAGQIIDLFGHKLRIKEIQYIVGYIDRAVVSCKPHCCTTPRHIVMELPVDVLEGIVKEGKIIT